VAAKSRLRCGLKPFEDHSGEEGRSIDWEVAPDGSGCFFQGDGDNQVGYDAMDLSGDHF